MLYSYSLQKTFGAGLLYYILVTEFNLIVLSSLVFPSHVVAGSIFFPHKSDDFLAIQPLNRSLILGTYIRYAFKQHA